jgi:VCBS repeat protein
MLHSSSPKWLLGCGPAIFLSLCLYGCGDSATPNDKDSQEDAEAVESDVLFEQTQKQASASMQHDLELRDAKIDGWPTEQLHDLAKHELKDFLHDLLDLEQSSADLMHYVADDFRGSHRLRPQDLQKVYAVSGLEVMRSAELDSTLLGRDQFAALLEEYRSQFKGAVDVHPDLKFTRVDQEDATGFSTMALLQIHGLLEGAPVQSNMQWKISWHGSPDDEHCQIRGIEVLQYEEFRAPKPLLGDVTEHVFAQHPFFRSEFLLGAGDLYRHKDRVTGNSYMGWQGVAVGDVNGDGREDLYVCQPGGLANRLFLRTGKGLTRETAVSAGVAFLDNTRAALLVDLDNDGDQDLVASMGPNLVLSYNDGRGRFGPVIPLFGGGTAFIHSISAADVDQDGDLDLYACRYNLNGEAGALGGGLPIPYHDANNGGQNILWSNEGVGKFTDITAASGLDQNNQKFSLASIWDDFDQDGDLDLFVTNDFGRNNYYRNDGGHFTDVAEEIGLGALAASMGASAADYDLDGDTDIYLSNMFSSAGLRIVTQSQKFMVDERERSEDFLSHAAGNFMMRNNGDGTFTDVAAEAGVALGRWAWGARFVDFNNDGYDDIYVPNGFITGPDTGDL